MLSIVEVDLLYLKYLKRSRARRMGHLYHVHCAFSERMDGSSDLGTVPEQKGRLSLLLCVLPGLDHG